ncbi:DinB family protein [Streptomyces sp. NPDC097619]|uniref:DinB family protein n=1 Tax=Streptomyces sp. NPDC097619 TaxID=3157228 RepID=UPI00332CE9DD
MVTESGGDGGDGRAELLRYLREARAALVWKVEGLSEYDARRPLTPTGTNLLGLVKHAAGIEIGYLGEVFGRPFPEELPWLGVDAEPNADMWVRAEESREAVTGLYRRACAHADATLAELPPGTVGRVPWWPPERAALTLRHAAVRVIADTHRHAGQADVLRELIDGAVGLGPGNPALAPGDPAWWRAYRERVERAAREAAARPGPGV